MKKRVLIFFLLLFCLGCQKAEQDISVLEAGQQKFGIPRYGGTVSLEIRANTDWTLSCKEEWCRPLVQEGYGNAVVEIAIDSNRTDKKRTGRFLLQSGELVREITVCQEAVILGVALDTVIVSREGDVREIRICANGDWKVECLSKWVRPDVRSGRDTAVFCLIIDPIDEPEDRETVVYVSSGQVYRGIIVKQVFEGDFHEDGEMKIYREEDAGNPIKLVFMGDGFVKKDLVVGGAYDRAMEEAIKTYLNVEPYKTYREYFCPYIVYACSAERGCTTKDGNLVPIEQKDTRFKVWLQTTSTALGVDENDWEPIRTYARKVPGFNLEKNPVMVVVNESRYYAGVCKATSYESIALVPMFNFLEGFGHLMAHEGCGHGFGKLADEYGGKGQLPDGSVGNLKSLHEQGLYLNVSDSQDKELVFWKDFIGREGYEKVGLYEGGNTYDKGIWRSEERCCMIDNIYYFNLACRLAIVKRLKKIAGEEFSLEEFITKDTQKVPAG